MGKKTAKDVSSIGRHYGKVDLDQIGFFDNPSPAPFDEYRGPVIFREGIHKGRQIAPGPSKKYFEKQFVRLFEGEALTEPWHDEAKQQLESKKKMIGGRMILTSPSKKHSTPGDWHGCFDKHTYFSPAMRAEPKRETPALPNMKIKPNPRGGPGYANICLSPFPSYTHEPYERVEEEDLTKITSKGKFLLSHAPLDYFPPNPYKDDKPPGPTYVYPEEITETIEKPRFHVPFPKKPGGSHVGCFDKFPEYTSDPYIKTKDKVAAEPKFVTTGPSSRSRYTNSIVAQITKISCNPRNYSEYRERAYPITS